MFFKCQENWHFEVVHLYTLRKESCSESWQILELLIGFREKCPQSILRNPIEIDPTPPLFPIININANRYHRKSLTLKPALC